MDVLAQTGPTRGDRAADTGRRVRSALAAAWGAPERRRLVLALGAAFLSALAFAHVAEDYLTNDPLARWDVELARWLAGERTGAVTDLFRAITFVGSPAVVLAVVLVACVGLVGRRRAVDAAFLAVVLGGAELLNLVLKLAFHRPRPEFAFVQLDTYSFPSGHAMASAAAYGALTYLAWGRLGSWRQRLLLTVGTVALVALIGFSRLYLGVHYLSDVLAGLAGGVFWLAVSIALATAYGARVAERLTLSRRAGRSRT